MTNEGSTSIKCKECGSIFQPDLKTRRAWMCPQCNAKNPNLRRHYRSVADLCILGLIATIIVVLFEHHEVGVSAGVVLGAASAILLLVTNLVIYKSKAPWANRAAKALIWMVFGSAFLGNLVVPLLLRGSVLIGFVAVYAIVFPYLFWLNSQANRCTVVAPDK